MRDFKTIVTCLGCVAALACADGGPEVRDTNGTEAKHPIRLDHTIVPVKDREATARFFVDIFGFEHKGVAGPFIAVQVNDDLTLDFAEREDFRSHHYAFYVSDADFDAIFSRIQAAGIPYGSGPRSLDDGKLNHRRGGRGVYFKDPNGHVLELLTRR